MTNDEIETHRHLVDVLARISTHEHAHNNIGYFPSPATDYYWSASNTTNQYDSHTIQNLQREVSELRALVSELREKIIRAENTHSQKEHRQLRVS
jgi:hypothetical protein